MMQDMMKELGITIEIPGKGGHGNVFNYDCSVNIFNANQNKQVAFSFYNGVITRIIGNSEYIAYGFNRDKTRIYFMSANKGIGFKASYISQMSGVIKRNIPQSQYEIYTAWKGRYYLRYDERVNYYYIDIAEKIKEV